MLRRGVSSAEPSEVIALRMFGDEAGLLPQQLYRQDVRADHDDHGDVEGDQRAEHEERPVIYHALSRLRHYVPGIDQSCEETFYMRYSYAY